MPHTPGPWRTQAATAPIDPETEVVVALVDRTAVIGPAGTGDAASDARLIAHAPELLSMLKRAVPFLPCDLVISQYVQQLITKVTTT